MERSTVSVTFAVGGLDLAKYECMQSCFMSFRLQGTKNSVSVLCSTGHFTTPLDINEVIEV